MPKLKVALSAAAVLAAVVLATTNLAKAQDYVRSASDCGLPPPTEIYIYPSANWQPFFRRHVYRYGPILVCSPSNAVISVRY
jgi:hypothetical protein